MEDIRIQLAGLWIALMLTYLLGDVLRIFAGHFKPGEIMGRKLSQGMLLGIAVIMLIPIVMILVSLFLDQSVSRWSNLIAAVGVFLFNVIGLPGYPGTYDKFLIVVSLAFNALTVWLAWGWT